MKKNTTTTLNQAAKEYVQMRQLQNVWNDTAIYSKQQKINSRRKEDIIRTRNTQIWWSDPIRKVNIYFSDVALSLIKSLRNSIIVCLQQFLAFKELEAKIPHFRLAKL